MASFSRCTVVGNCTRDPEVRFTPGGTAVADITLAVNDRRKDQSGNYIDEVSFIDCTLWGRTAEIAGEYVKKGSCVLVDGRLKMESWEKDGQKRSKLKVVAEQLKMLDGKGKGGDEGSRGQDDEQPQGRQGSQGGGSRRPPVDDGEIPF
jgi:single-strand DNA-binding protein